MHAHRRLLTNSSDRILRQFNLPHQFPSHSEGGSDIIEQEIEPTYRFSDPISKVAWHNMSCSPDGEWLAGGLYLNCLSLYYNLMIKYKAALILLLTKFIYGTSHLTANLLLHWTEGESLS